MIIGSSKVSMHAERTYSAIDVKQYASVMSLKGDEVSLDTSGEKSLYQQLLEAGEDNTTSTNSTNPNKGSDALNAFMSLRRPFLQQNGMKSIRSIKELRMVLLEQMVQSLQKHQWVSLKDTAQGMLRRDGSGLETLQFSKGSCSETFEEKYNTISLQGNYTIQAVQSHFYSEKEVSAFCTTGEVTTADGQSISFGIQFEMSRSFETYEEDYSETAFRLCDPLVINYSGNVAELTDQYFYLDLDGDGQEDALHQLADGSGLLCLDLNQDGQINDGSELFGPRTGQGFDELAAYDSDGNGWIDEADDVFSKLIVWSKDADGKDSYMSLKELGIGAIYLDSIRTPFAQKDLTSNETLGMLERSGIFLYEDGTAGTIQHMNYAI